MGYSTNFRGRFHLDRKLSPEHANYLLKFAENRHVKRDAAKTALRPDPLREAVGLPVGVEGEFFVGTGSFRGQEFEWASHHNYAPDVINGNYPPSTQPDLWCHWSPTKNLKAIHWNGIEKFHKYDEWLDYIIKNMLIPWGYTLNGVIKWQGDNRSDKGFIIDNEIVKESK